MSEVEFSGPARTIRMPIRGAIPVLTRAMRVEDAHPSVGLLSGATLLAMKLVAAGRIRLSESGDSWRVGPLQPEDDDRLHALATARTHSETTVEDAEDLIRLLIDAVVDTVTRPPSAPPPFVPSGFDRLNHRQDRLNPRHDELGHRGEDPEDFDLPDQVRITLRVEAPAEVLEGGGVVVVLQVHEADDDAHVVDADQLWLGQGHGFSPHARVNVSIALRAAAKVWQPLDRLQRQQVPDRMVLDADELADLLEHGLEALDHAHVDVFWPRGLRGELVPQARVEVATGPREGPLHEGLFGPETLFEFDWRLALGNDPLTDDEMSALASATTPVIRLRDNWMIIDPVVARRARRRKAAQRIKPVIALRSALTGTIELDGEPVEVHPGATLLKIRDRISDAATVSPLEAPHALNATLRDYQRHGLTWLAELTGAGLGACLADDMGLGKTITLIALHLHRRDRALATGPTLVVCPASLMGNWETEIHRFAPGVAVRRFHGGSRDLSGFEPFETAAAQPPQEPTLAGAGCQTSGTDSTIGAVSTPDPGFVLTTYGTMRRDHLTLAGVPWDLVVADEAQHIKNATSSTARNLRTIGSQCRVALTGTPVENNLTELWAILDWATPGLLGSRNAFRKVWAAPIESGVDPGVARRFAQLVGPFLLRRRKADPGIAPELPAKTETDQVIGLTREQVVLYEALVRESMDRIERSDEATRRGLVLALLTGLKQICNHPAHYLRQANGRLKGRSEKLELCDELLSTILSENGSVLVFTQYVAMARLLERHFAAASIPTLFLHGGIPVRAREQMVRDFQAGAAPVFLLSLKAGGTGLNLTRADHVIHFDRWWNPAVEDQATDRAHRIGQTRAVQVHRLVTQGTIEHRIGQLLQRKRSLAESVLGSGEVALTELSNEELRDLVTLRVSTGATDGHA